MKRLLGLLLLAGCVPFPPPADSPVVSARYNPKPLQPNNCGTPMVPKRCEPREAHEPPSLHIDWTPDPVYPIITEPLPDLTPLTDALGPRFKP